MRFFLLLIFFLSSCDFVEGLFSAPKTPDRIVQPSSQTAKTVPDVPASSAELLSDCAKILSSFEGQHRIEAVAENQFKVILDPALNIENTQLPDWALRLADEIFGKADCPHARLDFELTRAEGQLVKFKIFRDDFALYQTQQISLPEFGRRLEIEEVATLLAIKSHLKKAREETKPDEALRWVEEWLKLEPDNAMALTVKANVFLDLKDYPKAIELLNKVLQMSPQMPVARFNLAVAQKEIGSFAEAIQLFEELRALSEAEGLKAAERRLLVLHLADAHLRNNEGEKAQALLESIPAAEFPAVDIFRAEVLRAQKKFTEAKAVLENYIKSHPDDDLVHYDLVLAFLDLKDEEGAKLAFQDLKKKSEVLAAELEFVPLFKETKVVAPVVSPEEHQEFLDE